MHNKFKIAIADDHVKVREILKMLLEEKGIDVVINAENGEDLINQINSSSTLPDLCVIDHNMPIMDGCKTIQVIKSKWEAIKIIGISLEDTNEKNMINKGADVFLLKDHLPEHLYKTIIDLAG